MVGCQLPRRLPGSQGSLSKGGRRRQGSHPPCPTTAVLQCGRNDESKEAAREARASVRAHGRREAAEEARVRRLLQFSAESSSAASLHRQPPP